MNSGNPWNLRNSLLFSQQEQDAVVNAETLDPFVENMILERLAVQTPMRVSSLISILSSHFSMLTRGHIFISPLHLLPFSNMHFLVSHLGAEVRFRLFVDSLMLLGFFFLLAGAV